MSIGFILYLILLSLWSLVSIRAGVITIAALGSTLCSTPALKAWFRLVSELYYIWIWESSPLLLAVSFGCPFRPFKQSCFFELGIVETSLL